MTIIEDYTIRNAVLYGQPYKTFTRSILRATTHALVDGEQLFHCWSLCAGRRRRAWTVIAQEALAPMSSTEFEVNHDEASVPAL